MKPEQIFANFPDGIRRELFEAFNEIIRNFREERWEPSELNGGKLCEIIYTILRGHIDGNIPNTSNKPTNFVDACRALENAANFPRSIRIQIPRMLMALYEVRNNRGVGHAGGDVSPNHLDATVIVSMSKWLLAEMVRIFHTTTTTEAQEIVEVIIERIIPVIWEVNGKARVLKPSLSYKDKSLLILYHKMNEISESELLINVEHSNASIYRKILRSMHQEKLIEYDETNKFIFLSPVGIQYVEQNIL